MDASRVLAVSPRLELFFALAAVLSGDLAAAQPEGVRRWLDQARRKLDQGFRRRLGDQAQTPEFWRRLAGLPLPLEAAVVSDVDSVIEALAALPPETFRPAADPEAQQRLVVEALRRFDRLAFAAFWRPWREELAADAQRLEARIHDLPMDVASATRASAIFLPSRFALPGFSAPVAKHDTVLLPFDPERLLQRAETPAAAAVPVAPAGRPAPHDPALIFRALGDATRYTIAGLIAREPMTSAELARRLEISKPTMAHHLRALRAAGLVHEKTHGTRIALTLDRTVLESLSDVAVAQLFGAPAGAPIRRSRRA
jgi:DNA-binding transcriptional ArsR family regulator